MSVSEANPAPRAAGLPRWSLAALSGAHAAIFVWAAVVLPWRSWTALAVLSCLLAAAHLGTAVLAALAHRRLAFVWRATSVLSLAYLAYVGWGLLSSAWYVGSIYRGLGEGVAAVLGAVVGLVVLVTVPIAAWGIAATGGLRPSKLFGSALVLAVALAGGRLLLHTSEARGAALPGDALVDEVRAAIEADVDVDALGAPGGRKVALMLTSPAQCAAPPEGAEVTLIATYLVKGERRVEPASRCFQGTSARTVVDAFAAAVREEGLRGDIKLDLLRRAFTLPTSAPLVESLAFRPGIDGVCAQNGRCLMPWQLVALDAFVSHAPIPSVPDVRLGVAYDLLAQRLGATRDALVRVTTQSWLLSPEHGLVASGRVPSPDAEASEATVRAALDAAGKYIFFSQDKSGRFNYIVMPFTGQVINGDFSIARQAGTTLAACELAPADTWATRLAKRSLHLLAKHEQRYPLGDEHGGVLRYKPRGNRERLGPTALSLAAFITCRDRVGDVHDALIARLARTLLAAQRPDGSFHHFIDVASGRPPDAKGSIFVDGQAVFGLSLMETIAGEGGGKFPARAVFTEATERAMTFFGSHYWDIPLEPFLYIEENWHCIAAAGSLGHHRHEAYERFCLDYVAMKSRIVHEPGSAVHPDFIGGYGFGNVVPPHNTATAGYGEALAAAIKIKRARGMDVTADAARMQLVMAFLVKNQWSERACYACSPKQRIVGAFSEHMASPRIRIDYVQHVWSALGHGAIALGWSGESS